MNTRGNHMNYLTTIKLSMIASTLFFWGSLQAKPTQDKIISYQGQDFVLEQKVDVSKSKSYQAAGIYKGAKVKSIYYHQMGIITGNISVKLKDNSLLGVITDGEVEHIGGNIYLVKYNEQIDLTKALIKLKQMPQVDEAQIELLINREDTLK
tara:strand:+ start:142 stop:597 length:456 start_codon:yes stop_codon:yes gene_type:complete